MPTPVQLKRNGTPGASAPSSLLHGELALNYADKVLYFKDASNVITSFTFQSYALASHTHAASDITSGTLNIARIPTGSSSSDVCVGNDARLSDTRTPTDNTVSTAKIQNDAVTYAKIQNVSATDRLLGRSSSGAGDVEEITCTSFGRSLISSADASAARTTLSVQPTASPAFTGAATFSNTGDVVPLTVTNAGTANSFVVNDASGDTTPFVIDASGNVGIGTTSANRPLLIVNNGSCSMALSDTSTGGNVLSFNPPQNSSGFAQINAEGANDLRFVTNAGERLRISSTGTATFAGQVLVTAGSVSACSVAPSGDPNTGLYFPAANVAAVVTDGVERVRVNASGNVGIGTTDPANEATNARLAILGGSGQAATSLATSNTQAVASFRANSSSGYTLAIGASSGGDNQPYLQGVNYSGGAASAAVLLQPYGGEVLIGTTTDNGAYLLQVNSQIYATNATIATSDARFKTNVESLADATSVIESLRPVAFDFIPQTDRNFATERQVGLIAQEAQAALAGTDYADSVVAQCGDHLGLAYEKLVPVLIRALQESNARIAALEERLSHA